VDKSLTVDNRVERVSAPATIAQPASDETTRWFRFRSLDGRRGFGACLGLALSGDFLRSLGRLNLRLSRGFSRLVFGGHLIGYSLSLIGGLHRGFMNLASGLLRLDGILALNRTNTTYG